MFAVPLGAADPDEEIKISPDGQTLAALVPTDLPIGWNTFRPTDVYTWQLNTTSHLVSSRIANIPLTYPANKDAGIDFSHRSSSVYHSQSTHILVPEPSAPLNLVDKLLFETPLTATTSTYIASLRGDIARSIGPDFKLSLAAHNTTTWQILNEQMQGNVSITTDDASGGDNTFKLTGHLSQQDHILDIPQQLEANLERLVATHVYELKDHLGNVRSVVSARKGYDVTATTNFADVLTLTDYLPFGMTMPGRSFNSTDYRFGFNGQEKTDEISGNGNHNTALFWEYDARTGRRWNLDPKGIVGISDYAVNANNPIFYIDPFGDFKTKFGAKVYQFFHGGTVSEKKAESGPHKGEWSVEKTIENGRSEKGRGIIGKDKNGETVVELNSVEITLQVRYDWGIIKTVKEIDRALEGHSDPANIGTLDLGFRLLDFKGKPIIIIPIIPKNYAFTPANFVIAGSNISPFTTPELLHHELGHIIDFERMGLLKYTMFVSIPSVINFHTGVGGPHPHFGPETRANRNAEKRYGFKFTDKEHFPLE